MENKNLKTAEEIFAQLIGTNVNEHAKAKNGLTYLSWVWAWDAFKRTCPNASYKVRMFERNGVLYPYVEDDCGIMVFTEVTANDLTYEMWLPVMDGANKAMKKESYTYSTRYGDKTVDAATMFDINKTIMRCLTKNLAMFGLGLYIYAGEDLPTVVEEECTEEQLARMKELNVIESGVLRKFNIKEMKELTLSQAAFVIEAKEKASAK